MGGHAQLDEGLAGVGDGLSTQGAEVELAGGVEDCRQRTEYVVWGVCTANTEMYVHMRRGQPTLKRLAHTQVGRCWSSGLAVPALLPNSALRIALLCSTTHALPCAAVKAQLQMASFGYRFVKAAAEALIDCRPVS